MGFLFRSCVLGLCSQNRSQFSEQYKLKPATTRKTLDNCSNGAFFSP